MAKNNSYDKKIFRIFYILNKLNDGCRLKTSDLSKEFNVNVRTIQRDIQLLNTVGFPLISDSRSYKFMEGFTLRKITVSPAEKLLLTLFYKLFSKVGKPFDSIAKGLIDKVIISTRVDDSQDLENPDYEKELVLKKQVNEFSKSLAEKLQKVPDSPVIKQKIREFIKDLKYRVGLLKKEDNINIKFSLEKDFQKPDLICKVVVPTNYFNDPNNDPNRKLYFDKQKKDRIFEFFIYYPNKLYTALRIGVELNIFYKFFGTFLKPKKITCFDAFMKRLGFEPKEKLVNYETSYGNESFLITRLSISWRKEIPVEWNEIKPFLRQRVLIQRPGWKCSKLV